MRTWPGLLALGAGLIHLGSAAGTSPAVLVPLATIGAAEVLWGVGTLARPSPIRPTPTLVGVGTVLLLTAVALLLPPSAARHGDSVDFGVPAEAFAGAGLLDVLLAALLTLHLGREGREGREPGGSRPFAFLAATAAAAGAVAFVVIRSLAATSAGGSTHLH